MVRRALLVAVIVGLLAVLPFVASGCSEGKAVAQPSYSYVASPHLLDAGDFALMPGRATHFLVRVDLAQGLRILVLAEHPLRSYSLRRVAADDGTILSPQSVALQGGPHSSGSRTAYALLTKKPVTPGYYRLDLEGKGRVSTLAVALHP